MGARSGIEWTDATWNPVTGCTKVSAGRKNCYAERLAERFGQDFTKIVLHPERLDAPLRWRKPRRVFVNSMSDLFHEGVLDEFIDRVFAVMALAEKHTFQILTKRPERMWAYMLNRDWGDAANSLTDEFARHLDGPLYLAGEIVPPLPNVWLGVSIENQETADERIPLLLQTLAAVRFISAEPLLGPVDLTAAVAPEAEGEIADLGALGLDWVIVGGESGPNARPCNIDWIRDIVRQCKAAGVPCFVKQLGSNPITDCEAGTCEEKPELEGCENEFLDRPLRDRKGGDPAEWPEDIRLREYPR